MIKVNEIAFVCYPVTDKQRARDFYEGLLGLKQSSGTDFPDGFWIEYELGPAHTWPFQLLEAFGRTFDGALRRT